MAESEKFVIRKIFNNNVILAEKASAEGELIFVGKGIGFSHKAGDQVLKSELKIDKEFAPIVGEKRENYIQL